MAVLDSHVHSHMLSQRTALVTLGFVMSPEGFLILCTASILQYINCSGKQLKFTQFAYSPLQVRVLLLNFVLIHSVRLFPTADLNRL